jgi:fructokinase
VLGNVLVDEIRTEGRAQLCPGGAGLNVAAALREAGLKTTLAALWARDGWGLKLARTLAGVGATSLAVGTLQTTPRVVVTLAAGEPAFDLPFPHYPHFEFDARLSRAVAGANLLVVNAFDFEAQDQVLGLRRLLTPVRPFTVVDLNLRPGLIRDRGRLWRGVAQILPLVDLVKASTDDLQLLGGPGLASQLLSAGARAVFLTRSSLGAELQGLGEGCVSVPAARLTGPVVDTVGAGDAALAALLIGLVDQQARMEPLRSDNWRTALDRAMQAAARCCQHRGGPAAPILAQADPAWAQGM